MNTDEEQLREYQLHTMAVMAARIAVGLSPLPSSPDEDWWDTGPHLEVDGRSYFVHAIGCLSAQLGKAMRDHPDWYLVGVVVRGADCELRGLASRSACHLGDGERGRGQSHAGRETSRHRAHES